MTVRRAQRSLEGCRVGISISEGIDSRELGYSSSEVNFVMVRIAETLLSEGAHLVFGHNWRRDGVMSEVHRLAIRYNAADKPMITNLLPWPDVPALSKEELDAASRTLQIVEAGLPPGLQKQQPDRDAPDPWLRARALTWMRQKLARTVDAQISLGGRMHNARGRYPGVVEEVYLLTRAEKPVYLSALLGGATREMIRAIRRQPVNAEVFSTAPDVQEAFDQHRTAPRDPDARLDREALAKHFESQLTMKTLCKCNRLTPADNDRLCDAVNLDQVLPPLLRGLDKVARGKPA